MTMDRFAVLLNTSTDEVGQTANGLEYALDLDESGKEVEVFFDGSATQWPGELAANPEHPVNGAFQEARERGLLAGACSACAGAFETEAELEEAGIELLGDGDHGPSVGELADEGFDLLTIG
jgi:hypothetical protein